MMDTKDVAVTERHYWVFYTKDENECEKRIAGLFYPFHSDCTNYKRLIDSWKKGDKALFYCPDTLRAEFDIESVEEVPKDDMDREEYKTWAKGNRKVYRVILSNPKRFAPPILVTDEIKTELLGGGGTFFGRSLMPLSKQLYQKIKMSTSKELHLSPQAEEFIRKFKADPENQAWLQRKIKAFEKWRILFSADNIAKLSQEEFRGFLSFKENQSWDGIQRQPSVYADMDKLRKTVTYLVSQLNESTLEEIEKRLDNVLDPNGAFKINGLDRAVVTGIMHICDLKNRLGVWNNKVKIGLEKLGLLDQKILGSKGKQYLAYNQVLNVLGKQYDLSLYQVDMLMHLVATQFPSKLFAFSGKSAILGLGIGPRIEKIPSIAEMITYIESKGFYYPEETVRNYHASLETKPFVILSGITGIGKTKLTELYANAIYSVEKENPYYKIVSVQPNWNDKKPLLGYFNPIMDVYYKAPFLSFLLKALDACTSCAFNTDGRCSDRPKCTRRYFVCLDEMNLAHVEYYFADFLSAMESKRPIDLHSKEVGTEDGRQIGPTVVIPENLFVIGTVNIDETTKEFSPKVLDRANTIYLDTVDLDKWSEVQIKKGRAVNASAFKVVKEINELLKKHQMHFAYRVCDEILRYVETLTLTPERALDLQIMQKILPKMCGDDNSRLRGSLQDLKKYLENSPYVNSRDKVTKMLENLDQQGFTSFFD
jgi:MoxR-like ATPase